jgi:cyclic 2,3-diphosphoglycerate synthetase
VAVFTTAPVAAHGGIEAALAGRHGADVVAVCGALSDRTALRAALASIDAEVFCTEIKAAAIDVVAEEAARRGVEVVFYGNEPVAAGLDVMLGRLVDEAIEAGSQRRQG